MSGRRRRTGGANAWRDRLRPQSSGSLGESYRSGDAGWLVLEDDAVLASDVPRWLGQLPDCSAMATSFHLFIRTQCHIGLGEKIGDRWLVYANQGFYRATAYYVTPLAARRLLQASMPLWFPIDFWYGSPGC